MDSGVVRVRAFVAGSAMMGSALLLACNDAPRSAGDVSQTAAAAPASPPAPSDSQLDIEAPTDTPRVEAWEDGAFRGLVHRRAAERGGRTVVELGDRWAPRILAEDAQLGEAGAQPYRDVYLALADERLDPDDPRFDRAEQDRFFELFGISPTFRVVAKRLSDDARHGCHDAVNDDALDVLDRDLRAAGNLESRRAAVRGFDVATRQLEAERVAQGLASIDDLPRTGRPARLFAVVHKARPLVESVRAVQAHLRCEALLSRHAEDGVYDAWTAEGVKAFQRKHAIVAWGVLDAQTKAAFRTDSRELDFRTALRVLRERVVDATGVIEDGSASQHRAVLGRALDSDDMRAMAREDPLPNGAPDLVSAATEAAAKDLGWISPAGARAFLEQKFQTSKPELEVALRLPPKPAYYSSHMSLRAEIDRGDVDYDYPFTPDGRARPQRVRRRPRLVLYATHEGQEIALVRWNTTIGGWKPEQGGNGNIGLRYKESDAGDRVWRDLIAAPAWLPPESTPDGDLMRKRGRRWIANQDLTGPSYASAYGLVMLVNHRAVSVTPPRRRGAPAAEPVTQYVDYGIRIHGSASYTSILRGQSHGCHRLFNHLAVRLGGFVLAHREHIRHGPVPARYKRTVTQHGHTDRIEIDTRGVRFELTPPIPVRVLEGNLVGRAKVAPQGLLPLRQTLLRRARAMTAE